MGKTFNLVYKLGLLLSNFRKIALETNGKEAAWFWTEFPRELETKTVASIDKRYEIKDMKYRNSWYRGVLTVLDAMGARFWEDAQTSFAVIDFYQPMIIEYGK